MKRSILVLTLIVVFGLTLRLAYLGSIPGGFTPDEASQGYAAYSLLKTGKDEWGVSWPLTSFRAFADYRAPLQTYLIIPSVAVFGLTEFAVRLPSAIFGALALIAVYLLTNKMFGKLNNSHSDLTVGHLTAFFLAISPWHIQFSRTALEANFTSFLFPLGLFFLLNGLEKPKLLILAALTLGLDLYSYLAAKLFIPLFLVGFVLIFHHDLIKLKRKLLAISLIIFLVFAAPIYFDAFFGPGNTRGKDLIITNLSRENLDELSKIQYQSPLNHLNPSLARVFTNKAAFIIDKFVENYISYLSPTFWFTEGGRETTYSVIPGRGLLYFWMILPIGAGLLYFLSNRKELKIFLLWLLIGIIPAALTKEGYRPNRSASLLTLWEIIASVGTVYWIAKLSLAKRKAIFIPAALMILVFSASYLYDYAYATSIKYPDSLVYGYRDVVKKVADRQDHYQNIIVDRGSQSQVFFAFYEKIDPVYYQEFAKTWWPQVVNKKLLFLDMLDGYRLGKFIFKSFNASEDVVAGNLVVIPARKINNDLLPYVVDTVRYPDRSDAFYLLSYEQKQK